MKLLFNESHLEDTNIDFFWYLVEIENIDDLYLMYNEIINIVSINSILETHYIFYTNIFTDDAIGDKVRTTVLIRKQNNLDFDVTINISDFQMALNMDNIINFKNKLSKKLNRIQ